MSIKHIYEEYGSGLSDGGGRNLDAVSAYFEHESISHDKLVEFIKSIGQRFKKLFKDALMDIGKTVLGKEPEYYDDFYFFRNKIYCDIDNSFLVIDPLAEVKRILRTMEFDLQRIHFDTEDRRNKYPSPICFFVRIPYDIRILYKRESIF